MSNFGSTKTLRKRQVSLTPAARVLTWGHPHALGVGIQAGEGAVARMHHGLIPRRAWTFLPPAEDHLHPALTAPTWDSPQSPGATRALGKSAGRRVCRPSSVWVCLVLPGDESEIFTVGCWPAGLGPSQRGTWGLRPDRGGFSARSGTLARCLCEHTPHSGNTSRCPPFGDGRGGRHVGGARARGLNVPEGSGSPRHPQVLSLQVTSMLHKKCDFI